MYVSDRNLHHPQTDHATGSNVNGGHETFGAEFLKQLMSFLNKRRKMNTTDIDLMCAEKGSPCLSIIIPTHGYSRDRIQNPRLIENAILKSRNLLANGAWPKDKAKQMQKRLDSILERVDYIRLQEGLAIFISPGIFRIYLLPFQVKEKVMLGNSFEIRDLVYFSQFLKPYYLLAISKKRVRLFKGSGRDLQEITNSDFPKQYKEEYEYARPTVGSSSSPGLKAFERDKSIVQQTRMKAFFMQADDTLNKYLKEETPLFVAGVSEELVNYEHISHHAKQIAGKIAGNYDIDAVHPLAEDAWAQIKNEIKTSHAELLVKLQEDFGKRMAVDGVRNVWKAAKEGKGLTLLLEKDYQVRAFQDPLNDSQIFLTPPVGKYDIIVDAPDDIIETVEEKGGNVAILENGDLKNFDRIAMILRYTD